MQVQRLNLKKGYSTASLFKHRGSVMPIFTVRPPSEKFAIQYV